MLLLLVLAITLASEAGSYYYLQITRLNRQPSPPTPNGKGTGRNNTNTDGKITGTNSSKIVVNVLINYGNGTNIWYNETNIVAGTTFYNLTLAITHGNVESVYYPLYNSHYITGINGVYNNNDRIRCSVCWILWNYCKGDNAWASSLLGADLIKLENGDTYAWYIQDITRSPWQSPEPGAKTMALCS